MTTDTIRYADLPALGAELFGGHFYGLTTRPDNTHCAIVLMPDRTDKRLTWKQAIEWANKTGGELPTRPVSALLYALAKPQIETDWYWTADELDGSYAWGQSFGYGFQDYYRKSYEGRAVAVRRFKVIA